MINRRYFLKDKNYREIYKIYYGRFFLTNKKLPEPTFLQCGVRIVPIW